MKQAFKVGLAIVGICVGLVYYLVIYPVYFMAKNFLNEVKKVK